MRLGKILDILSKIIPPVISMLSIDIVPRYMYVPTYRPILIGPVKMYFKVL